jgi:PadR family transcriptional regulator PadR
MTTRKRRVGRTGVLGAFEELVLLAALHEARDAYAVSIRRALVERLGSEVAMGAVYATLDRLELKKLVVTRAGEESGGPGRPRTYYDVTADGYTALQQTRDARQIMWQGIRLPAWAGERTID